MKISEGELMKHIERKNHTMVKMLIDRFKFDIHYNNEEIFKCACEFSIIPIIKLLIDKYPNINYKIGNGCILIKACKCQQIEVIELLMEKFPDIINKHVVNEIMLNICRYDQDNIFELFINKYPDTQKYIEYDVMFINAGIFGSLSILKILYQNNYINEYCKMHVDTIFGISAYYGYFDILKWLVDRFDIDYHENCEYAFRCACDSGNMEILLWLKQKFPDINHHVLNDWCYRHTKNSEILDWLKHECPAPLLTKSARKN